MGGMIVQQYTLEYERAATVSLLCTSPGGEDALPVPEETQAIMYATPEGASDRERIRHRMAPAMSEDFPTENPETIERIVDWRLDSDAPDHAREAQGAAVLEFDVSDRLGEVTQPAQILHGTADRVVPVENAALLDAGLPNSRTERLEGGPHLFFVESPTWVNERLRSFVEAHSLSHAT
jgi:pimeloyl-ACP methyl ester carboxylesterase